MFGPDDYVPYPQVARADMSLSQSCFFIASVLLPSPSTLTILPRCSLPWFSALGRSAEGMHLHLRQDQRQH
jgi:hypothetical protein